MKKCQVKTRTYVLDLTMTKKHGTMKYKMMMKTLRGKNT